MAETMHPGKHGRAEGGVGWGGVGHTHEGGAVAAAASAAGTLQRIDGMQQLQCHLSNAVKAVMPCNTVEEEQRVDGGWARRDWRRWRQARWRHAWAAIATFNSGCAPCKLIVASNRHID